MACTCLETVDKNMREKQGGKVEQTLIFPEKGPDGKTKGAYLAPIMRIMRLDTGNAEQRTSRYRFLAPTFCPFCGVRYEEKKGEPTVPSPTSADNESNPQSNEKALKYFADFCEEVGNGMDLDEVEARGAYECARQMRAMLEKGGLPNGPVG